MQSTKNSHVNEEVERLMADLKEQDEVQYAIVTTLIQEMYTDPKRDMPEGTTRAIEDKIYRLIDEQARFN